jgi:hypothetical protein
MLPSDQTLLHEIDSLVGQLVTPSLSAASKGNDLFEAYLFALSVEAAESVGATPWFETRAGVSTRNLVLRTSPGSIYSTVVDYTHAVLEFPVVPPLEIHLGVYVAGRSTVVHECDVCIVDRAEAERCRRDGVHPRSPKVRLAVEAKFYGSSLGISLAREFTGLCADLSAAHMSFVSNTSAQNVARLLSHRFTVGAFHPEVTPGSPAADDFRSHVRQLLRRYQEQ